MLLCLACESLGRAKLGYHHTHHHRSLLPACLYGVGARLSPASHPRGAIIISDLLKEQRVHVGMVEEV